MKLKTLFATAFIAFVFTACNSQTAGVKTLSADDFQKGLTNPNVQLIDVRTPQEFNEKHIAGAVNINLNGPDFEKQLGSLDKAKPVYVYCLAGSRSSKAAGIAAKEGFASVNNLEGGIKGWIEAQKPVTTLTGEAPPAGLSFNDYLNHVKSPGKLVLVDFNAVWCGPCKQLKPLVHRQVKKNSDKVELLEIDVDKNPEVANTMNITGIPLLVLYKNGKEVWRSLGLIDESELADNLKKFM